MKTGAPKWLDHPRLAAPGRGVAGTPRGRIGDGTAAFYNYVYYTVAGFTEHDTFRSNQIREGQITREKALELLLEENAPRYQSIRWYLDTLQLDFESVIKIVNNIPKLYYTKWFFLLNAVT